MKTLRKVPNDFFDCWHTVWDSIKSNEIWFLVWDSIKSLMLDLVEIFSSLKKAKTWSFILYATFFLAVYYKQFTVMKIALPLIILLYIIRRYNEPEYKRAYKDRAFLKGNVDIMRDYYEKYQRQCYFAQPRKQPLPFESYKKEEINKILERAKDSSEYEVEQ